MLRSLHNANLLDQESFINFVQAAEKIPTKTIDSYIKPEARTADGIKLGVCLQRGFGLFSLNVSDDVVYEEIRSSYTTSSAIASFDAL